MSFDFTFSYFCVSGVAVGTLSVLGKLNMQYIVAMAPQSCCHASFYLFYKLLFLCTGSLLTFFHKIASLLICHASAACSLIYQANIITACVSVRILIEKACCFHQRSCSSPKQSGHWIAFIWGLQCRHHMGQSMETLVFCILLYTVKSEI